MSDKTLGQVAYAAFVDLNAGLDIDTNEVLPTWEQLSGQRRMAWECAALAVNTQFMNEHIAQMQTDRVLKEVMTKL